MGRPAKFDRDAAVKIAMNEMWTNGFELVSVQSLSEKLGITRSSFYNAFVSREALIDEALDLYFSRTADGIWVGFKEGAPVLPMLAGMVRKLCKDRATDVLGRGCMAVNGLTETNPNHAAATKKIIATLEARFARLDLLLTKAVENGELKDDGCLRDKALALQSLLLGLNMMAKLERSEDELWRAAKTVLCSLKVYEPEP